MEFDITNVMYVAVCVLTVIYEIRLSVGENATERAAARAMAVGEVADALVQLLRGVRNESARERELASKLARIDSYVINKDQYAELLRTHARRCDLNETNFFKALQEQDNFLMRNESGNIFLKMKAKMNRDDLLRILATRGKRRLKKSARRMMDEQWPVQRRRDRRLNEVVDRYLGETPRDNHTFGDMYTFSPYWDPQPELEARQEALSGRRIYKGDRTSIIHYPFVVSIHLMGRFWCGGSIYWDDLILTSASCLQLLHNNRLFRENPKVLAVRVGSNHSRASGELIPAVEVYFHPAYMPVTLHHNIAVIRLQRILKMTYHRVPRSIQISHFMGSGLSSNVEVIVLGWGVSKTSQKLSYEPLYLQRKILPVYPNKFCQEIYGEKFVTGMMFCAGTMSTGEGACAHDGGGPAVVNGELVGVVSYGPVVCGTPDMPTVFTLVGPYSDWIENINATMPEFYRGRKRTTTTQRGQYRHLITYTTSRTTRAPEQLHQDYAQIQKHLYGPPRQNKTHDTDSSDSMFSSGDVESSDDERKLKKKVIRAGMKVTPYMKTHRLKNNNYRPRSKDEIGPFVDALASARDTAALLNDTLNFLKNEEMQIEPIMTAKPHQRVDLVEINKRNDEFNAENDEMFTMTAAHEPLTTLFYESTADETTTDPNIAGKFIPGEQPYADYIPIPNEELEMTNINVHPDRIRAQDEERPEQNQNPEEFEDNESNQDDSAKVAQPEAKQNVEEERILLPIQSGKSLYSDPKQVELYNEPQIGDVEQDTEVLLIPYTSTTSPVLIQSDLKLPYELGAGKDPSYTTEDAFEDLFLQRERGFLNDMTTVPHAGVFAGTEMGIVEPEDMFKYFSKRPRAQKVVYEEADKNFLSENILTSKLHQNRIKKDKINQINLAYDLDSDFK